MPTPTTPPEPPHRHHWTTIALGRVCSVCGLAQAKGEFDDSTECPGR